MNGLAVALIVLATVAIIVLLGVVDWLLNRILVLSEQRDRRRAEATWEKKTDADPR